VPWVYAESFVEDINQNVLSSGGFTRNIKFWHDLTALDGIDVSLVSNGQAPHVTFKVFQNIDKPIAGKPKIWAYGLLAASSESDAYEEARAIPARVTSLVSLALRIPLRATGDLRILNIEASEHGWTPHFEDEEFVGIDVLMSPPEIHGEERQYEAKRYLPYHQPTIGSVTNKKNLSIYFTDAIRQVDKDTSVSVEHLHVDIDHFGPSCAWLASNNEEEGVLHNALPYYAAALTQQEPVLQFLLLWNCIEHIVNSVECDRLLTDEQINNMLDSESLDGLTRERAKVALKQLTTMSFRDKAKAAFESVFGQCLEDAEKTISSLRSKRSAIVHPRLSEKYDTSVVSHIDELRKIIEAHLDVVREKIAKN